MIEECREYVDSLYPKNRKWNDKEIVDVMIYYTDNRFPMLFKYQFDKVIVFDSKGNCLKVFNDYEEFVDIIGGNIE